MKGKVRGVCAFDLDATLTCGDAAGAIARCEQAGYGIAVNTARPSAWLEERLQGIGLPGRNSSEKRVHVPEGSDLQLAREHGQKREHLSLSKVPRYC